jgi:hypothetical protein
VSAGRVITFRELRSQVVDWALWCTSVKGLCARHEAIGEVEERRAG